MTPKQMLSEFVVGLLIGARDLILSFPIRFTVGITAVLLALGAQHLGW